MVTNMKTILVIEDNPSHLNLAAVKAELGE